MVSSQTMGQLAFYVGREFARDAASFKLAVEHDMDRIGFQPHFQDPFDPVMRPVWQMRKFEIDSDKVKQVAGTGMIVLGTGMLIPGPTDVAVGAAGFYFGGPAGAFGAVALYNITGAGLVVSGYMLTS